MARGPCNFSHICRPGYSSAHSLLGFLGILRKVFEGLPLCLKNIELNPLCICIMDDLPAMCCAECCHIVSSHGQPFSVGVIAHVQLLSIDLASTSK